MKLLEIHQNNINFLKKKNSYPEGNAHEDAEEKQNGLKQFLFHHALINLVWITRQRDTKSRGE